MSNSGCPSPNYRPGGLAMIVSGEFALACVSDARTTSGERMSDQAGRTATDTRRYVSFLKRVRAASMRLTKVSKTSGPSGLYSASFRNASAKSNGGR